MTRSYATAFSLPKSTACPDGQPELRLVTGDPRGASRRRALQTALGIAALLAALAGWFLVSPAAHRMPVAVLSNRAVQASAVHVAPHPGFLVVTGSVRNTSGRALTGLEAAVSLVDRSGRLLSSQAAVATDTTMPAGASVPFRIVAPTRNTVTSARVWFRSLDGPALP
ncbi:MAG: FxLYD domain-containing protein [Armatimonadetes bacterium]|nr:FxLYD domain-containing protein [Armatimonadota bacterium]MDE2206493.1 FxLYD domain-containing protein [Armatimonadota bacterium]